MRFAWRLGPRSTPSTRLQRQSGDVTPEEQGEPPFVLEERVEEVGPTGAFTPRAALWLSPTFKESGLLRDLEPGELCLLLGVLACLSPNASFLATPGRVASAVGASPQAARQGLERLCQKLWQGKPLLLYHEAPSGLRFFVPSPHLVQTRRSVITPAPAAGQRAVMPFQGPGAGQTVGKSTPREEVVAHSRSTYARPRAQVEAEIEAFLESGRTGRGFIKVRTPPAWEAAPEVTQTHMEPVTPEASEWLRLKRALVEVGVPSHRADELLDLYPPERIERQLRWLPLRAARTPVAYLLGAIERDYAPPSGYAPPKGLSPDEPPSSALTQGEHHEP